MKLETSETLDTRVDYNQRSQSLLIPQSVMHTVQIPVTGGIFYTQDFIWAPSVSAFSIFSLPQPLNVPVESSIFGNCLAIQHNGFFTPATPDTNAWPLYLTVGEIKSGGGDLFTPLVMWELPELHFDRFTGIFTHTSSQLPLFDFDWTLNRTLGACVCFDSEIKPFFENEDIANGEVKASVTIGQVTKGLV